MVEGARLESVYTRKGIAGSNPALSAFGRRSFSVGDLVVPARRPSADAVRLALIGDQ